jgi:hypothetical protein
MNTHKLTKQERIQLVLEGVLSADHVTYEEVMEILDVVEELIWQQPQTHYAPDTLQ